MTMQRLRRLPPILLFALGASLPAAAPAMERIPFSGEGAAVAVQASVDGKPPVTVNVDLSAGVDEIGPSLRGLAYDVSRRYVTLRANGDRVDLALGRVVSLALGDFAVEDRDVAVLREPIPGAAGVVSAMAFRSVATTFDFPNRQAIVEDAASYAERKRSAAMAPLIVQDDRGIALRLFAWFDFGGHAALCAIDTAAGGITIDSHFAALAGISGATISSISLREAPRVVLRGATVAYGDSAYDCEVGNAFWQGRSFTIDVPNRMLWVSVSP